jgi:hypothetical protein
VDRASSRLNPDLHKAAKSLKDGTQSLKACSDLWARDAALKGPLFHGIIGGIAPREENAGVSGRVCVPICRMQ